MIDDNLSIVEERPKGRVSAIWILPIVAAMIGGWLIYKSILEAPIEVTVTFESGEGIAAGKTEVRYEGIQIGIVSSVVVQPDLSGIIATLEMDNRTEIGLLQGSQFWLVKPEVSLSGVTGLGTVLSGNYITVRIGDGAPSRNFTALSSPPPKHLTDPGLHLILKAKDLGSLSIGSPIKYKKFTIGGVQSFQLDEDGQTVTINIFIEPKFSHLVQANSRFWNASGISIRGGITGFDIRTESLASILKGGIGLSPVDITISSPVAKNSAEYTLFDDYVEASAGAIVNVSFPVTPGIEADVTKVIYRGLVVGQVQDVNFNQGLTSMMVTISLLPRATEFINKNTRFWISKPQVSLSNLSGVKDVFSGTQIELDFDDSGPDTMRDFVALKIAPILEKDAPGLHITLKVDSLKSVSRGMDILYRNIVVGSILDYRLSRDSQSIELDAHIKPKYVHLVNKSTHFWDAGGIEINGGLDGVKIRTGSITSILLGGIAFYTPDMKASAVTKGERFRLYSDYDSAHAIGIPITLYFDQGEGLKEGTSIKYEGIEVGTVTSVELNKTLDGVVVQASLKQRVAAVAKENTQFWLVKPQLGLAKAANLETLITGQYITFRLGDGESTFSFTALNEPPMVDKEKTGLNIVLSSKQLASVKEGVAVAYRGVVVGKVSGFRLANTADYVKIFVNIEQQYAPLVRSNSKFWNASGLDFGFKLFGGAKIKTESLESILAGGISFATPNEDKMGPAVGQGAIFSLNSERKDAWLDWHPKITLDDLEDVSDE